MVFSCDLFLFSDWLLGLLRFWYYMFVRTLEIVLSFRDLRFVSQLGIKG